MITPQEAARMKTEKVVAELSGKLQREVRGAARVGNEALALRNVLNAAVREMMPQLCAIYAEIPGAGEAPLRDELRHEIATRMKAFVSSTVAGVRGANVGAALKLQGDLHSGIELSVINAFDLAVFEFQKDKLQVGSLQLLPTTERRKQDKFGILDARTHHYDEDYRNGVGMLGVAVIYFDLDHFKAINTRFTEPVVDRELLTDLNKLVDALVEGRGFGYAEGGDEFLILLPNTSLKIAEAFVQELLDALREKTFVVQGEDVRVRASAGIAWSNDPEKAQACLDAAALAKKAAKDSGRDRYAAAPT